MFVQLLAVFLLDTAVPWVMAHKQLALALLVLVVPRATMGKPLTPQHLARLVGPGMA